jgi:hypothetical protein
VFKGADRIPLSYPVAGYYEHGNESSSSIRGGEFLGLLNGVFASERLFLTQLKSDGK